MTDIKKYEPLWGSWYVESMIGEGSFGKVYRVKKEEFSKTYYSAVKIISIPQNEAEIRQMRNEGMDNASARSYLHSFVADIIQEIDLMSAFRGNSNIVSLEDHKVIEYENEIGWDIIIRMELLTSLSEHVTERPMTYDDVVRLGIHICRALELCAQKKTIHRDIKPDNIFISQYGEYKLGDFGIARQIERTMSGMSKKGTYTYMAPEVFKGDDYGASVDIYSLGIVMYRFLNKNRTPFLPEFPNPITPLDRDEALQRRMSGENLPPIESVAPALCEIVLKACSYDRDKRFGNATEMREALERLSAGISIPQPEILPPVEPQIMREPSRKEFTSDHEQTESVLAGRIGSLPRKDGAGPETKETEAKVPSGLLNKLALTSGIFFGVLALLCRPGASLNSLYIFFGLYLLCIVQCALRVRNNFADAIFVAANVIYLSYSFLRAFQIFDYHLFVMTCGFAALWAAKGITRRGYFFAILGVVAIISGILAANAVYGIRANEYHPYLAGSMAVPFLIAAASAAGFAIAGENSKRKNYGASALIAIQFFPLAAMTAYFISSAIRRVPAAANTGALFYMVSANALRAPLGVSRWLWLSLLMQPLAFAPFFLLALARITPRVFIDISGKNNIRRTAVTVIIFYILLLAATWAVSAIADVLSS